ncbi:hypothetical protein I6A60_01970 [Frankia sp. AgB1.9]|uniref:hypothetical protein n=1 Tax=unclassified Frankia TaxID=2632575 RepID=UPI0019328A24|nr:MULTISPECIES: hypothetical protein [unclassified Frankia]MBL7490481.1 hypothetical protein [Frankia sp. AgW1.1]MBL7546653.1 hypothetical protein [Frankia sp. AgB1.9]MBL7624677.1 hypothetical protein [Frankia sp. AgB1.8]
MVLAGDLVRASDGYSDWTAFTPSWVGFTQGNGTIAGAWRRIGNHTIDLVAQFLFGSTSSIAGSLGLVLPAGLSGDGSAHRQGIPAFALDSSTNTGVTGVALLQSGGGTTLDRIFGAVTQQWSSSLPFTWASGDLCLVQGTVRITT